MSNMGRLHPSNQALNQQQQEELAEWQKLIWKAAIANADNPLGYRLLDAHMSAIAGILSQTRTDTIDEVLKALPDNQKTTDSPRNSVHQMADEAYVNGHNDAISKVKTALEGMKEVR